VLLDASITAAVLHCTLPSRSFCFVDDLVEGLIKLMASDMIMPVNIGNPCEFTILQLAELTIKV
jgi:UDP-glucuronate decarboxylase